MPSKKKRPTASRVRERAPEPYGKPRNARPAYFLSLTVENVRCFGPRQTLDLSKGDGRPARWTVILGDNGSGKSTLLESLVALEATPFLNKKGEQRGLQPLALEERHLLHGLMRGGGGTTLLHGEACSHLLLTDARGSLRPARHPVRLSIGPSGPNIRVVGGSFQGVSLDIEGLICYAYGASRRMGSASLGERANGGRFATLFDDDAELSNAEEWLLQADYAASKGSEVSWDAAKRRDQIKGVLVELLPDVSEICITLPSNERQAFSLEFKTPYGWVTLDALSLGYRTLIAWMVDLASRLFDRYPDSRNPLAEPAIVLVDEIDLHLHPSWQRKIMSYLSARFPNTQFIATAHSPLVVQAAEDANIAVLRREGDHVVIDNNREAVRGWRVDQVLTSDLFGLESGRSPRYEEALKRREKLLSKSRLTKKDREELVRLEAEIEAWPVGETKEDREAMDIIRRAAAGLKQGE